MNKINEKKSTENSYLAFTFHLVMWQQNLGLGIRSSFGQTVGRTDGRMDGHTLLKRCAPDRRILEPVYR